MGASLTPVAAPLRSAPPTEGSPARPGRIHRPPTIPAFFAPYPDDDLDAAPPPDPAHGAAAHRVVTTRELTPFASVLLDLDVDGGPDAVDW
jgi:hypothetical protein